MESAPVDRPAALMDGAGMLFRTGRNDAIATTLGAPLSCLRYRRGNGPPSKPTILLGELLRKKGNRSNAEAEYHTALTMATP